MAALAIVSIATASLLHLHLVSVRMADTAQTMVKAVLLAQERIALAQAGGVPKLGTQSGTADVGETTFDWRVEVTGADSRLPGGVGRNGLRELRVTVAWPDGKGRRNIQTTTYIADSRTHAP